LGIFLFPATFTGFFLPLLGGTLATATLSVSPLFFTEVLAALLRVTLRVADLVSGAIVKQLSAFCCLSLLALSILG
jgi:hypothetical protein